MSRLDKVDVDAEQLSGILWDCYIKRVLRFKDKFQKKRGKEKGTQLFFKGKSSAIPSLDSELQRARLLCIPFEISSWTVVLMQTAKDSAKHLIDTLPDTATTSDILRELYVRQKIERGLKASDEDRVTPQAQVLNRFIR